MAESRIRQSRIPEILAQFGGVNPVASGIDRGIQGFQQGLDLASTIASRRAQKEEQEAKIAEIQNRIKAQKQLTDLQAQGPVTQPQPTGELAVPPTTQPSLALLGLPKGIEGPAQLVPTAQPEPTMQPAAELEAQRQQDMLTAAGQIAPKALAEQVIKQSGGAEESDLRGRDIQQKDVVLKDGSRMSLNLFETVPSKQFGTKVTWTDMSGNEIDPSILKGAVFTFAPKAVTDAQGNVIMADPITAQPLGTVSSAGKGVSPEMYGQLTDVRKMAKEDREDAVQMIMRGKGDENTKKARKTLEHIKNIRRGVATENVVLVDRLGGQIQKFIGEDAGNLAQWEQRDPNSRAYLERLRQWYSMSKEGRLAPAAKQAVLELMDIYEENYIKNIQEYGDFHAESITQTFPELNKNAVLKKMGYGKFMEQKETNFSNMSQDALEARIAELQAKQQGGQ